MTNDEYITIRMKIETLDQIIMALRYGLSFGRGTVQLSSLYPHSEQYKDALRAALNHMTKIKDLLEEIHKP